jgi:hypothetical protein
MVARAKVLKMTTGAPTQVVYPVWTDGRNSPGKPLGQTDIFTNVEIGGIP